MGNGIGFALALILAQLFNSSEWDVLYHWLVRVRCSGAWVQRSRKAQE